MGKRLAVAIDGPAGAGKSTVARMVADRLGYAYVDTGAMYRAVAWRALQAGLQPERDAPAIGDLASRLQLEFHRGEDGAQRLLVDGEDASHAIRTTEVSNCVSPVSALPVVREHLTRRQRELGLQGGVVMEGRDIQTVVLPEAEVKVFLTATAAERARRRLADLQLAGEKITLEEVLADIEARDKRDSSRAVAPLTKASDAIEVLTDGMTIEEVVATIVELAQAAGAQVPA
jgi:cytidylate kinase